MCVNHQTEDVLKEFLKQKSVDSKAILQADKKLTEKEKINKGESLQLLNPNIPFLKGSLCC